MRSHIEVIVEGTIVPICPCLCGGDVIHVEGNLESIALRYRVLFLSGVNSIFFDEKEATTVPFRLESEGLS